MKTVGGYFFCPFLKIFSEKVYICPNFFALKVEGFLINCENFQKALKKRALPLGISEGMKIFLKILRKHPLKTPFPVHTSGGVNLSNNRRRDLKK